LEALNTGLRALSEAIDQVSGARRRLATFDSGWVWQRGFP
jgi:hypothetical protein